MKALFKTLLLPIIILFSFTLNGFELPQKKSQPDIDGYYYTLLEIEGMMAKAIETQSLDIHSVVVDVDGKTIAHYLAFYNSSFTTKDKKVLSLQDNEGTSVAHLLAKYNKTWSTNDISVLKLTDKKDNMSVAHNLALSRRWETQNVEVLSLMNKQGYTVAHYLARFSTWTTKNKEVLGLKSKGGIPVKAILRQNKKL